MTFRNPNRRLGIYYESIEAAAVYGRRRLSTAVVHGFYLGHKEENNAGAVFNGEQLVVGGGAKLRYESEKIDGVYIIDLKMRLKIRIKVLRVLLNAYDEMLTTTKHMKGKNFQAFLPDFALTKCNVFVPANSVKAPLLLSQH
ncbi:hypothetical protein E3N88_32892 [Mikania micrantha]|uniref:Uncharacterized protein n=1 Tax=Mikania micrantha TaxID=192012 RepID=A0A5N6MA95_9ASTR|nr:hypothetical protein E3N88_32892 [Mikania micrantha]